MSKFIIKVESKCISVSAIHTDAAEISGSNKILQVVSFISEVYRRRSKGISGTGNHGINLPYKN